MEWQPTGDNTPLPLSASHLSSLKTHDIVKLLKLVDGHQHLFTTYSKLRQLIGQRAVKVDEIALDDKLYSNLCKMYLESIEFAEKLEACITSNLDPSLPRSFTVPKRKILGEDKSDSVTTPKIKKKRISASVDGARDEIKPGDDVAARIHTKEGINWILAKVREARSNGKYDVEDEDPGDEESQSFKRRHILTRDALILLPKELRYEFAKGVDVLAMYPQTTTFYRARVVSPPASRPKSRDYVLRFEEDDNDCRVAPHYVVAAPSEQ